MIPVPLVLRYPGATLAVALVLVFVLGAVGLNVDGKLRPTGTEVSGTGSSRAGSLLRSHFGDSASFAILLGGPAAALDRQGPALIRRLRAESPGAIALSPWGKGRLSRMHPSAHRAMILVDFRSSPARAVKDIAPRLDRSLAAAIHSPVIATQTGFATLSCAIQDETARSTRVAELVAIPFLLIVLLIVFRSPIAAAIPLAFGAATVIAGRGVLALAAPHVAIDGFALTVCSMMGLALGVDYTLLMVSRFREELGGGALPSEAARRTRGSAGRTTAFAGLTVALAMVVTLWVMPGNLFLSLAGAAILVAAISVAMAYFVAPPLLYLVGSRIDRWRLPLGRGRSHLTTVLGTPLRRPRLAAALIGGGLLLLAAPALALKTGAPSIGQLPASNKARQNAETVERTIGPGWDAPFVMVSAAATGSITSARRLTALERTQRQVADDPEVQDVFGPGRLRRRIARLRQRGDDLLTGRGDASPARIARLGTRLDRAAGGLGQLRGGLLRATNGAGLLAEGSGRAEQGAAQLAAGLQRAGAGVDKAVDALGRLDQGSGRLAEAQRNAALGARTVADELRGLLPVLRRGGLARARQLRASLQDAAVSDPALRRDVAEAGRLVEALTLARNQAKRAHVLASRLHGGQVSIAKGGVKLHRGAAGLANAATGLPAGLRQLGAGAAELSAGLAALGGGASALQSHLARGFHATRPLQGGLARVGTRVSGTAVHLRNRIGALRRSSPGLFGSGYFALSALDGAPAPQRQRLAQLVDLAHGGQAAQTLIVPRHTYDTPQSDALYKRLQDDAAALERRSGLETGITGGPAELADYTDAISSRIPLVIIAISLATFLVLILVLRALPLAAIAVGLNLLTVAVAFGVLTMIFDVPSGWPLGGHTYVDSIGAAGIFGIVFGLSIDYAVFLLSRMREHREAGATTEEAVHFGLQKTARVITGAAAIMLTVFVAFAAAPIATVSQLGTGLSVAVVLDATVVRLVLLPALILIVGDRIWWLPRPLERALPRLGFHSG